MKLDNHQPLVGILAGKSDKKHFTGNELAFQRIQLALQKNAGLSFVFTTEGLTEHSVKGFTFDFKQKKWAENSFPHPDVVYNRIPFRKYEQINHFSEIKMKLDSLNIPYFNECYFQKWDIYELLSKHKYLHSFLPKTIKLESILSFESMILQFKRVYVKPSNGRKGNGIFIVEKASTNSWNIETIHNEHRNISYAKLMTDWILPHIEREYILQQAISPLKWKGSRFDYRVLVHRKSQQEFIVSGIGVRHSQLQQVTTHVPAGGKIISFEDLPFYQDKFKIDKIASITGQLLLLKFQNIGEFSMDIGKDVNGDLFLFEVNSKPMVFDEDEIRRKGLDHLIQLFTFLSKNTATSF